MRRVMLSLVVTSLPACGDSTAASATDTASGSQTNPTNPTNPTTPTTTATETASATDTVPTEGSGTGTASGGTTGTSDPSSGTTVNDSSSPLLDVGVDTDADTGEIVTCDDAANKPSNFGCEFWAVDMDQQDGFTDPASAPWGVAISAAGFGNTEVSIEINLAPPGQPLDLMLVKQLSIGQDEVVPVGRRRGPACQASVIRRKARPVPRE